jgi:hypothetical protein
MFRISRSNYDKIHSYLVSCNAFFKDGLEVTKWIKISSHGKVLLAQKYLSYGCSVKTFWDYFQVGKSMTMKAVKVFEKEMSKSPFLVEYFGSMTPADARRVEKYHCDVHGAAGMI